MEKFIIKGGQKLKGSIAPAGNKNEALPVLAAVLLTDRLVTIHNLPNIGDVNRLKGILEGLGVAISYKGGSSYQFDASQLLSHEPDRVISESIRGSFLLAAPLLVRFCRAKVYRPGGDAIGRRRLDTHLEAMEQMGVMVKREENGFTLTCSTLTGVSMLLDEASVMATENIVMAAVLARGSTTLYHAACEPHVQGLCHMLNRLGAKIEGIGSNLLRIEGVSSLSGGEYTIQPDHTEVGSFIGLAAVTRSEITIHNPGFAHLRQILRNFERLGVRTERVGNDMLIPADQEMVVKTDIDQSIPKIDDAPWPAFPADLTSIMTVVATQCRGTVLIFEKMFESRLFWIDKLIGMGAKIILCDPHRAVVAGPTDLHGAVLTSPDIRAGMALLIAALCAEGTSEIYNIRQIDRGYKQIERRLMQLGADIQRV